MCRYTILIEWRHGSHVTHGSFEAWSDGKKDFCCQTVERSGEVVFSLWKESMEMFKKGPPQRGLNNNTVLYIQPCIWHVYFWEKKGARMANSTLHKEVTTAFGPCHPNWCLFRVLFCDEVDGESPANQLKCLKYWSLCKVFFWVVPLPTTHSQCKV